MANPTQTKFNAVAARRQATAAAQLAADIERLAERVVARSFPCTGCGEADVSEDGALCEGCAAKVAADEAAAQAACPGKASSTHLCQFCDPRNPSPEERAAQITSLEDSAARWLESQSKTPEGRRYLAVLRAHNGTSPALMEAITVAYFDTTGVHPDSLGGLSFGECLAQTAGWPDAIFWQAANPDPELESMIAGAAQTADHIQSVALAREPGDGGASASLEAAAGSLARIEQMGIETNQFANEVRMQGVVSMPWVVEGRCAETGVVGGFIICCALESFIDGVIRSYVRLGAVKVWEGAGYATLLDAQLAAEQTVARLLSEALAPLRGLLPALPPQPEIETCAVCDESKPAAEVQRHVCDGCYTQMEAEWIAEAARDEYADAVYEQRIDDGFLPF